MPRELAKTEIRLNSIATCVTITANTLDVLVNTLNISALEAVSNTTQSLLKMVETIKQDKDDCAELMEHIQQLLNAIISVYIKSDTGAELPPSILNQIAKFTETLHKIHTFVEAQQSGSKVKKFFRQGELNALLKDCRAGLQQGLDFFQMSINNGAKAKMTTDMLADAKQMQDQAQLRHQEEPKIFHGRDSELADILNLFSQGTPRLAILGAGGMGKTSLARTALHHEQIITKYQGNRFFVACDTASSKAELAGLIGAHLGMKPGKDLTRALLWHFTEAPPSLLILDNLETVWEPVESRKEIEEFLSLLTDIASLALVVHKFPCLQEILLMKQQITMRGAERPAKVQWTRPFLLPLRPLAQDAAQKMFIDIADNTHSMEEVDQVLHLTGNMPLSISLLAHLVDMEGCTEILSRWEIEKTSLISEGYDKRSNLEQSISLSLSSPRITSMPHSQDLLALLSILPDGLSDVELKQSQFPIEDILGCKATLLRTALAYTDDHKRLKVLVPVREYMGRLLPPTDQMIRPLLTHFHELLEVCKTSFGKESEAFPIARIASNYTNIQNVLRWGLQLDHPDVTRSIYCICDFSLFTRRLGHAATALMEDISCLLPSLHDHRLKTYFIVEMFNSLAFKSIFEPEMLIAEAVNSLKHFNDPELESKLHGALAWYYSEHTHDIPKAVEHCQTALFLARENTDYKRQCIALHRFSRIEWLRGDYTAGQAYAQEEQKVARISGDLHQEANGLYYEALCWNALGYYKHCISLSTRARTLLDLCGMSYGALHRDLVASQAEIHRQKSEYVEAHNIQNQGLQGTLSTHSLFGQGFFAMNIAEVEVFMGVSKDLIQKRIDASGVIFKKVGNTMLITACDAIQADLNLREGDMSSSLFCKCLRLSWGSFAEAMSYCLERLGDNNRWEGSHHPSSWTTIFLVHSLKAKERLGIHKALQFLGDVFLKENDEATAISLFTLALEGFSQMDVHRSRAECIIRLGDISKKNGDLLKALELWETARPLFERSSQVKRVQDIDERLAGIDEEVKEQHRINLAQLAELNAPAGKVEEVEDDSSEDELEREREKIFVQL
ncbi:hypothetical protein C8F04DRAFT_1233758 [Mycena alexandri]|uniref:Novel STAND NTPase 1 domain-containing protein n=1 Tax=Mycena alexandri TaxID=1745969 RepID=A0AAD6SZU4_9AGAR|nr:hypothetical protein C8F04DRAFT_1233758 [Mycena alexandri]